MAQGIQVDAGHRLRDLTASLSIIGLGAAVLMAVRAGEPPASLHVPCTLFAAGCAAIALAYAAGFVVDRLADRWPGLTRTRRCPRLLLLGVPALAVALAATQFEVAAWLGEARDVLAIMGEFGRRAAG